MPLRVLVQGGGIAGLTCGIGVKKLLGDAATVRVLEISKEPQYEHGHIGLWTPALWCLHQLGVYSKIRDDVKFVTSSSYRSTRGDVIASPSKGLSAWDGEEMSRTQPSLGFVERRILMSSLAKTASACGVELVRNSSIVSINPTEVDGKARVTCSNAEECRVDLVVGADGKSSRLRKMLAQETDPLVFCGYKVYRGHSTHILNVEAFQTWGIGARFAVVPTKTGSLWFAAVTDHYAGTGQPSNQLGIHPEEYYSLVDRFSSWHDPVSALVLSTDGGPANISLDYAFAFDKVYAEQGGRFSSENYMRLKPAVPEFLHSFNACFIGDAGYTLDPILAQGGGLAIEDSYILATALRDRAFQRKNSDYFRLITAAIRDFERKRSVRKRRLAWLSAVSQTVGHMESSRAVGARDSLMTRIPDALKGPIFDYLISQSVRV